jgi:ketosteroid isomerase-like protein
MEIDELEGRLATLEEELRVVRDIEAIRQLQYRYINGLAFTDWDSLLDCFADDAVFDVGPAGVYKGTEQIRRRFTDVIMKGHHGTDGVFLAHPIISVEGDKANGSWLLYWLTMYELTGQALFWAQFTYDIDYARVNGQWKISVLRFRHRIGPLGPGGLPIEPPYPGA